MNSRSTLRNQYGYTLIEAMVALAVIGILANVAIPKFNFLASKARQSGAKSLLKSLYTAEKTFDAEWNGYTGDLRDIGMTVTGSPLVYDIGFAGVGWFPTTSTFIAASSAACPAHSAYNTEVSPCAVSGLQAPTSYAPAVAMNGCGGGIDPTPTTFRATAIGRISTGNPLDVWTIDELGQLCNNQSGL